MSSGAVYHPAVLEANPAVGWRTLPTWALRLAELQALSA
jgi:hypothetical protein